MTTNGYASCVGFAYFHLANTKVHRLTKYYYFEDGILKTFYFEDVNYRYIRSSVGSGYRQDTPDHHPLVEQAEGLDSSIKDLQSEPIQTAERDWPIVFTDTLCLCPCCGREWIKKNMEDFPDFGVSEDFVSMSSARWRGEFDNTLTNIFRVKPQDVPHPPNLSVDGLEDHLKVLAIHHKTRFPEFIVSRCEECRGHKFLECLEKATQKDQERFDDCGPNLGAHSQSALKFLRFRLWKRYRVKEPNKREVVRAAARHIRRHSKKLTEPTRKFFQLLLGALEFNKQTTGACHERRDTAVQFVG